MKTWIAVPCVVAFGVTLGAHEKGIPQDYTNWSDDQAQRMLSDSPWTQQVGAVIVVANADDPRERPVPLPTAPGQPPPAPSYKSDGYGVDDGNWDGGVGRIRRGQPPTIPVIVRWDSALPVRAALLKTHAPELLDTQHTLTQPEKNYIVTVIGLVPAHRQQTPVAADADDPGRLNTMQVRNGLRNASRLVLKNGRSITPGDVHFDEITGTIQIYFPRKNPILLNDKEVTFRTTFGSLRIVRRFRLKEMVFDGKLEL